MKQSKFNQTIAIGFMLFALFFGAGNLIFPASMGQNAGENVWYAVLGFIVTGVGLPFLGVLAMGYSGCKDLQELSSRISPRWAVCYTVLLYITIGPSLCTPRTGTVSYEIAVRPFLPDGGSQLSLIIFLAIFFGLTYWLSVSPQKLVDRIGKILTPALLLVIVLLIVKSFITPLGTPQMPAEAYATAMTSFSKGFLEGYGTMDALGSLVFSILVIQFIIENGADTPQKVTKETCKAGAIAAGLLGIIYICISYLGATSVSALGILSNGAPVLANSAKILFGPVGAAILAIIVLLACLSTSIGLVTSGAAYFYKLCSAISYKMWVFVFSFVSFVVGIWGLTAIIQAAVPVLTFLYPLTAVLIFLTLADRCFKSRRCVYVCGTAAAFLPALISGCKAAGWSMGKLGALFDAYVPLHTLGLDWILFGSIGVVIGLIYSRINKK